MGNLVVLLVAVIIGAALSLQKMRWTARSLQQRCVKELSELKTELERRHTIVLHLIDSLPGSWEERARRRSLCKAHASAADELAGLDPQSPSSTHLDRYSTVEQFLAECIDGMLEQIQEDPNIRGLQTISGCVAGILDSTKRIKALVSTYNSAAINLQNYLESSRTSLIRKAMPAGEFVLVDIEPPTSSDSHLTVKS